MQSRVNVMLPTVRPWLFCSTVCKGGCAALAYPAPGRASWAQTSCAQRAQVGEVVERFPSSFLGWKRVKNWKTMNNYMVPSGIYTDIPTLCRPMYDTVVLLTFMG